MITFWNPDKAFGFIRADGQRGDVFFHVSQIRASEPGRGERAEFEVEQSPRSGKPQAVGVYIGG